MKTSENDAFEDDTEVAIEIPAHLVHVLDGLAQTEDDLELDQAALSLTACIGKGKPTEETEAAAILNLVPELLAIIEAKALNEDKRLMFGRGDISANLWTCIHLSTSLLDLRSVYPNLGETHFEAIFHTLDGLAKRRDLLSASSKQLGLRDEGWRLLLKSLDSGCSGPGLVVTGDAGSQYPFWPGDRS